MKQVRTRQVAALPWREGGQGTEVLLISSRETKRWVIPKGWPIPSLSPPDSALREAFEEAGVGGQIARKPAGHFGYMKRMKDGTEVSCSVEVFPLEVMVQHREWPEQGQRDARWFKRDEAAAAVDEPGLAAIIRKLK